jgi:ADP-ribose pyrophosphatase YjhB (NUDIX family)
MSDPEFKRSLFARLRGRVFHGVFLLTRPLTFGVRAAVFDAQDRVFLVRHTYVPGWHFPGGGVEVGESAAEALRKELREEGNIVLPGPPRLFALYHNRQGTKRDHVALYVVTEFDQTAPRQPDREIAETGFFALNALPEGVTRATLRRLAEIAGTSEPAETW